MITITLNGFSCILTHTARDRGARPEKNNLIVNHYSLISSKRFDSSINRNVADKTTLLASARRVS